MRRRLVFYAITGVILALLITGVYLSASQAYHERALAERFVGIFTSFKVGVTTEAEVQNILRPFSPRIESVKAKRNSEESLGDPEERLYRVEFANGGLTTMHLADPAKFSTGLIFHNGTLVTKVAALKRVGNHFCMAVVSEAVEEFSIHPPKESIHDGISVNEGGNPADLMHVRLYSDASEEVRKKAYEFNLSYLTSFSGCTNAHELLPEVVK